MNKCKKWGCHARSTEKENYNAYISEKSMLKHKMPLYAIWMIRKRVNYKYSPLTFDTANVTNLTDMRKWRVECLLGKWWLVPSLRICNWPFGSTLIKGESPPTSSPLISTCFIGLQDPNPDNRYNMFLELDATKKLWLGLIEAWTWKWY